MKMILLGDSLQKLATLKSESVQCVVTSPPYWGLRDYGHAEQLGQEPTPELYVEKMRTIFEEVRRVLKSDGTLWLNLGDTYVGNSGPTANSGLSKIADRYDPRVNKRNPNRDDNGSIRRGKRKIPPGFKPKDLVGIPWRVAFALQSAGWYLRQDIIWQKPNPMPESVRDRCTKAHEYIFLFSKSPTYYYDHRAVMEPVASNRAASRKRNARGAGRTEVRSAGAAYEGTETHRNRRSVWTVTTKAFKGAHFATFPPDLIEPCILAGSARGDTILDPFFGSGTTGVVARKHARNYIGIEINPDYAALAQDRLKQLDLFSLTPPDEKQG